MKKLFISSITALLLISGCTTANKADEKPNEPQPMEAEEESEIELEEGESSGGL